MPKTGKYVPDTLTFLRDHFGLRYWLADPEGETIGLETRDISADELRTVLKGYTDAIKRRMYFENRKQMQIFVGGPVNGRRHFKFGKDTTIAVHIGRAKWAVYVIGEDHLRAWFRGYATSQKKAGKMRLAQ